MPVKITETTLRDAHQSLMATRLRTADISPITEELDRVGFFPLEAWGGATFDSGIRFLNEDPWECLSTFKVRMPKTRLQMLLHGQNLVSYRHYADDVVQEFVRLAIKNGISIIRIFDALNDIRNMTTAIQAVKAAKAHVQGTICCTLSPVHTVENFVKMGLELENLGCDSICVKDMAGLIKPKAAHLLGERCARVSKEVKEYCLGFYGKPPGPIDPQIKKKIIGKEKPIEARPADLIKPQLKGLKKEAQRMGILKREEDLITYALYPNVAPKFLRGEIQEEALPINKLATAPGPGPSRSEFQADVDGELSNVRIYPVAVGPSIKEISIVPAEKTLPKDQKGAVLSPIQDMVLCLLVKAGDKVEKGKPIAVLEAMKMEMPVESPHAAV